jgi:hypothetical protein
MPLGMGYLGKLETSRRRFVIIMLQGEQKIGHTSLLVVVRSTLWYFEHLPIMLLFTFRVWEKSR